MEDEPTPMSATNIPSALEKAVTAQRVTTKYKAKNAPQDYTIKGGENGMAAYRAMTVEEIADFVEEALQHEMIKLHYWDHRFDDRGMWKAMKLVTQSGRISVNDDTCEEPVLVEGMELTFDPDHAYYVRIWDMGKHMPLSRYRNGKWEKGGSVCHVFPELLEELHSRGWAPHPKQCDGNESFFKINKWINDKKAAGELKTDSRRGKEHRVQPEVSRTGMVQYHSQTVKEKDFPDAEFRPATPDEQLVFLKKYLKKGGKISMLHENQYPASPTHIVTREGVIPESKGVNALHVILPAATSIIRTGNENEGVLYMMKDGSVSDRKLACVTLSPQLATMFVEAGGKFKAKYFHNKEHYKQVQQWVRYVEHSSVYQDKSPEEATYPPITDTLYEENNRVVHLDAKGREVAKGELDVSGQAHGIWMYPLHGLTALWNRGVHIQTAENEAALREDPRLAAIMMDQDRLKVSVHSPHQIQEAMLRAINATPIEQETATKTALPSIAVVPDTLPQQALEA